MFCNISIPYLRNNKTFASKNFKSENAGIHIPIVACSIFNCVSTWLRSKMMNPCFIHYLILMQLFSLLRCGAADTTTYKSTIPCFFTIHFLQNFHISKYSWAIYICIISVSINIFENKKVACLITHTIINSLCCNFNSYLWRFLLLIQNNVNSKKENIRLILHFSAMRFIVQFVRIQKKQIGLVLRKYKKFPLNRPTSPTSIQLHLELFNLPTSKSTLY